MPHLITAQEIIDRTANWGSPNVDKSEIKEIESEHDGYEGEVTLKEYINLESLDVNGNKITQIDVTENFQLKGIKCSNNKLSSLNLSNNVQLELLIIKDNWFNNISLLNNTFLTTLDVSNNKLKGALELFHCENLRYLNCSNNQLTSLYINSPLLSDFNCEGNDLINQDDFLSAINTKKQGTLNLTFDENSKSLLLREQRLGETSNTFLTLLQRWQNAKKLRDQIKKEEVKTQTSTLNLHAPNSKDEENEASFNYINENMRDNYLIKEYLSWPLWGRVVGILPIGFILLFLLSLALLVIFACGWLLSWPVKGIIWFMFFSFEWIKYFLGIQSKEINSQSFDSQSNDVDPRYVTEKVVFKVRDSETGQYVKNPDLSNQRKKPKK